MFVSALACSLHAVQSKRFRNGTNGASPSLISQEHLVRKAASLCYLLSNEFTVSLVSNRSNCSLIKFLLLFSAFISLRRINGSFNCLDSSVFTNDNGK